MNRSPAGRDRAITHHRAARRSDPRSRAYRAREVEARDWPDLLERCPAHTVFHTLPWLRAIEALHGASLRLACVEDGDGAAVGLWPIFSMRKGPLRIVGSPRPGWNTAYLGPIFAEACDVHAALTAFFEHPLLRRCSYFACKSLNTTGHNIDLAPFGFSVEEELDTYCVDLSQSLDELWSNLKSECRTQIRKARKLGLQTQPERDDSFLEDYWQMTQETFGNCGLKPPFTRRTLHELWKRLHRAGTVRALSAWHRGERIATLFLPFDRHTMYYWAGASYLRCRSLPAHNLLHWDAIEFGHAIGLRNYDFVATSGSGGRFKKTFGPRRVMAATHWERTSSPLVRVLKTGYQYYLQRRQWVSA